jgi:D-cysteine desulfhydrase
VSWIPLGGTSPLGVLGHVNAGLELAEQIQAGLLPCPEQVVVPLGTGGTAAGLALGFALAGLPITVLGARVGPRIGSNLWRVRSLIRATGRLLQHYTGRDPPVVPPDGLHIAHGAYGGAYGRPYPPAEQAAALLRALTGWRLDSTYSAKALLVALDAASRTSEPVLFWLTFDARWLADAGTTSSLAPHTP